jgi:Flp pilus assembly pilin Flp
MKDDDRDKARRARGFCLWRRLARRFAGDRGGATALEYALLIGMISLSIILALVPTGEAVSKSMMNVASGLADGAPASTPPAATPPAATPPAATPPAPPSPPKKKKKNKVG